jgi:hypothetical protein
MVFMTVQHQTVTDPIRRPFRGHPVGATGSVLFAMAVDGPSNDRISQSAKAKPHSGDAAKHLSYQVLMRIASELIENAARYTNIHNAKPQQRSLHSMLCRSIEHTAVLVDRQ